MVNILPNRHGYLQAQYVWNAYSVFPSDHFDVPAVFYLIVDVHFFLPSVAFTINSLTTPLHLEYSFHLKLYSICSSLNLCVGLWLCVCVCVWIRTSEKQRASGMQSNIFTMRNSFEDNSSLLPRCDDCFLYELSEKNSKLIFKCHHMCLWLTVIDAIYGCVWDMQYRVELNWKQHVIAGTMG